MRSIMTLDVFIIFLKYSSSFVRFQSEIIPLSKMSKHFNSRWWRDGDRDETGVFSSQIQHPDKDFHSYLLHRSKYFITAVLIRVKMIANTVRFIWRNILTLISLKMRFDLFLTSSLVTKAFVWTLAGGKKPKLLVTILC